MEDVVAELRGRLRARHGDSPPWGEAEQRLRRACRDSTGHLLITGSNRAEIHAILTRVLDEVKPLGAIRTLAVDADPNATIDRVISAFEPDAPTDNYLDRRAAVLELVSRAAQAGKSIFVVVDDAEHATIEQLEQLRASLEVAPEAIERLRLVLVGEQTLAEKLESPAARALRSRITASVTLDDELDPASTTLPQGTTTISRGFILACTALVVFIATSYALHHVGLMARRDDSGQMDKAPTAAPAPAARATAYGIRGDEPFLHSTLRIAAVSAPRKKIIAPQPPRVATPKAAAPLSPAATTKAVPAQATRATTEAAERAAPSKTADPGPSRGSSIGALMNRFPAGR